MVNHSSDEGASSHKPQRPAQYPSRQAGRQRPMRPVESSAGRGSAGSYGSGRLENRVALITGGDSGIGRAIATAFAREGADVMIVCRSGQDLASAEVEDTLREIHAAGRRAEVIALDMGEEEACWQAVEETVQRLGALDILVNHAAAPEGNSRLPGARPGPAFRTNLFSLFHLTKAALPYLRTSEGASIINTTSVTASHRGLPLRADASAGDSGIVSFTRSLSQQLAAVNIRVNAVVPGAVPTSEEAPEVPARFDLDLEAPVAFEAETDVLNRDCAEAYVYLASADSSFMTGQTLRPTGGEVIHH